ncbi:MAG TPA: type IV pili twitching motility protein PilT, partial [Geomobilimonas sp.]|nr:type IV pili twitching motility protein PilT [Geomobilimonas sp.]
GMQSFDQSLMQLYTGKLITYEEALRQSSNPDDFALKVSGISSTSNSTWDQFGGGTGENGAGDGEGDSLKVDKY